MDELLKTEKTSLTTEEIEWYIGEHELPEMRKAGGGEKARLTRLWRYFKGKNPTILDKPKPDENNPDNRTPVPYGRKIVTTFTGYAYRPRYITYKPAEDSAAAYVEQLQASFDVNREHIKTERAGRNTAIYGYAYELMYIEGVNGKSSAVPVLAEPRFFPVDPREIILLYDYAPEPKRQLAIRYYPITPDYYKVEVYEKERVLLYDRKRSRSQAEYKWVYTQTGSYPNYFEEIPVVPYYMGDDYLGIVEPVVPLIDDYDLLLSDSFNEEDRFANAYLIMKKMSLVTPELKKEAGTFSRALALLKRRRVFENVPDTGDVKFLTKELPTQFIDFVSGLIERQIHVQSHVPDFREMATGQLSGAAIRRLMFDFENVVSSAEADFDEALYERIRLMNVIYAKSGRLALEPDNVVIVHRRNMPEDYLESGQIAESLKGAGFSRYLVADAMPDTLIPDVDEELARQDEDQKAAYEQAQSRMEDAAEIEGGNEEETEEPNKEEA